jgi:hypothetical protein
MECNAISPISDRATDPNNSGFPKPPEHVKIDVRRGKPGGMCLPER